MHSSPTSGVEPTPKKGFRPEKAGSPFPNFLLGKHEVPSICRCVFDGDNFYVLNSKDMHLLNHNGSFGVSSLTYRGPSEEDQSFYLKPYYAKKVEREATSVRLSSGSTKDTFFKLIEATEFSTTSSSKKGLERNGHVTKPQLLKCNARRHQFQCSNQNQTITKSENGHLSDGEDIIYDKNDEDVMEEEEESYKNNHDHDLKVDDALKLKSELFLQNLRCNIEEERLILMPEEAIFLSFGVGCLTIHGLSGSLFGYKKVWRRLVESNPEFPILYAVYHYFRSKNWVPKLGDSYGASYLLYKIGPAAYHASYLVHILGFPARPSPTWNELNAWVRLGCHVSKNVMLCEVSVPRRFDAVTSEPRSIFDMSLKETSLFRWKSTSASLIKF